MALKPKQKHIYNWHHLTSMESKGFQKEKKVDLDCQLPNSPSERIQLSLWRMSSKFKWTRCALQMLRGKQKNENRSCKGSWGCVRYLRAGSHCPWQVVLVATQCVAVLPRHWSGVLVCLTPCTDSDCSSFQSWPRGACADPHHSEHCPQSGAAFGLPATKQGAGFANVTQRALDSLSLTHQETNFGFCSLDWRY